MVFAWFGNPQIDWNCLNLEPFIRISIGFEIEIALLGVTLDVYFVCVCLSCDGSSTEHKRSRDWWEQWYNYDGISNQWWNCNCVWRFKGESEPSHKFDSEDFGTPSSATPYCLLFHARFSASSPPAPVLPLLHQSLFYKDYSFEGIALMRMCVSLQQFSRVGAE